MQCLILAGGLGTRMRPYTQNVPKVLLRASGQPFLSHQLQLLASHGIKDIVLSIGHLGHLVREFAGDGHQWGVRIRYADEGETLQGTGGAVRKAYDCRLLDEAFFVLYGDSFTPVPFVPIEKRFRGGSHPGLMVIMRNDDQWDRSNVLYENGSGVYDKSRRHARSNEMRHIDYGVSILTRDLVKHELPPGRSDLADLYAKLSLRGELGFFEVNDRFYEIGSAAGLAEFENYINLPYSATGISA